MLCAACASQAEAAHRLADHKAAIERTWHRIKIGAAILAIVGLFILAASL